MDNILPSNIRKLYPFESRYFQLSSGHHIHYVDEGEGPILLMLHGNPTWSFMYRNIIKGLRHKYRCIAIDHIGCGLSDKPQKYPYRLKNHINNIIEFVRDQNISHFSLLIHDWGGPIGLGLAQHFPERLNKLIITNTAGFPSRSIPWQINLCRIPGFGPFIIRGLNGFAKPATFMSVKKPLDPIIKAGYCYPYNNWNNRIATHRFVKDIPMSSKHPSRPTLEKISNQLELFNSPNTLLCWGMKDFCFHPGFLKEFQKRLPLAKVQTFEQAGHYLFEDEEMGTLQVIENFLREPVSTELVTNNTAHILANSF